jgi:hypothetical protein
LNSKSVFDIAKVGYLFPINVRLHIQIFLMRNLTVYV